MSEVLIKIPLLKLTFALVTLIIIAGFGYISWNTLRDNQQITTPDDGVQPPVQIGEPLPRLEIKDEQPLVTPRNIPSGERNVPSIPGANLLISVVDEQGQTVTEGTIEISTEFPGDLVYYNYQYSVNLSSVQNGLLALYPPPSHTPATVLLQVITPDGKTSDTLVIKNDEFWKAVAATERNFVASHKFDLRKSGEVTTTKWGFLWQ